MSWILRFAATAESRRGLNTYAPGLSCTEQNFLHSVCCTSTLIGRAVGLLSRDVFPGSQLGNQVFQNAKLPFVSVTVITLDDHHILLGQGCGIPLVFQVLLFSEDN